MNWLNSLQLRFQGLHGSWQRMVAGLALTALALAVVFFVLPADGMRGTDAKALPFYSMPFGSNPLAPGEWKTPDGKLVDWRGVPSARDCAGCHRKEFMEWNTSLHAISDRDVIYDASVRHNTGHTRAGENLGDEKGRWCESCHNPLGTLTGAVTPIVATQETEALEEGVNCITCHTAAHPEPLAGNGALTSFINRYFRHLNEAEISAAPSRHAADMQARRLAPHMGQSGLCGACHTEIRPTEVSGDHRLDFQSTYNEWRISDFPRRGIECQNCHMAQDPAKAIAAIQKGERPAHQVSHRLIGGNYLLTNPDLPDDLVTTLRGGSPGGRNQVFSADEYARELKTTNQRVLGLLQSAAELQAQVHQDTPSKLAVKVVVRNVGAGHALPTGPLDQRHMWLEVVVRDAAGKTLLHSGAFDRASGKIAADAVMWRKEMRDAQGQLDLRHTLFDVAELRYPRPPIPAGASQDIAYTVAIPRGAKAPFQVEATLHYRLAFEALLENAKEVNVGDFSHVVIPPVTMATAQASTPATGAQP